MARPVEVAAGGSDYSFDFVALKRMRQHVVAAAIQDLGPKLFVSGPASDDQLRRMTPAPQVIEHVCPTPFTGLTTGDYHLHRIVVDALQGLLAVTCLQQNPSRVPENLLQQQPAVLMFAHQKRADREFTSFFH
jgi:hypothetical protein